MGSARLTPISEDAFNSLAENQRIFSHDHARRYAVLHLDGPGALAISWRSDLIEPCLLEDSGDFWIGVDERVACVSPGGQILLLMEIQTPILALEKWSGGVVVVSQTQAIVFHRDGTVRSVIEFPDLVQDFKLEKDDLTVDFFEQKGMVFSL
jgi:hypothetical protein